MRSSVCRAKRKTSAAKLKRRYKTMSATKSIGTKIVTAMIATGLAVTAAFAGSTVTVTLPESVTVGSTTLSGGQYTVSEFAMSGGRTLFVFRSDKGETASALGLKNA